MDGVGSRGARFVRKVDSRPFVASIFFNIGSSLFHSSSLIENRRARFDIGVSEEDRSLKYRYE